ncbi:hypothetical protein EWM64_g10694 [Hericium alpestre]|uniref:Uncharacterized protein n=1 Tax=Hericium alpestre TaxID=135208 RepID=A0A4Y9ZHT7_9AGAM|nr:hypothetical protein EWM64_g10694 [Hericium alpestre]
MSVAREKQRKEAKKTKKKSGTKEKTSVKKTKAAEQPASSEQPKSKPKPRMVRKGMAATAPTDPPEDHLLSDHTPAAQSDESAPAEEIDSLMQSAVAGLMGLRSKEPPVPSGAQSDNSGMGEDHKQGQQAEKRKRTEESEEDEGEDEEGEDISEEESEEDNEDSEDDNEDSAVEEAPAKAGFKVKFSVPFNGATESISISSKTSWTSFVTKLANLMSVSPKHVSVAYRFSVDARSSPFSHLSKASHLRELFNKAPRAARSSRSKKEFFVELKDLSQPGGKSSGGKDKKVVKKAKRRKAVSDSDSGVDSDRDADGEKARNSKKSTTQWVAQLEHDNKCDEHVGRACIKLRDRHIQLSRTDLHSWAIFLQSGYASTTSPPPKLVLDNDKLASPAKVAGSKATDPQALPLAYPAGYPMMPPDPVEDAEDVSLFPLLTSWLADLDSGKRGQDGHDFSQFAPDFAKHKYIRIIDIEALTTERIIIICPGIPVGTADKILAYACKDAEVVRKQERQCLRELQKDLKNNW